MRPVTAEIDPSLSYASGHFEGARQAVVVRDHLGPGLYIRARHVSRFLLTLHSELF
jgi:hypothetical protein